VSLVPIKKKKKNENNERQKGHSTESVTAISILEIQTLEIHTAKKRMLKNNWDWEFLRAEC